MKRKFQHRLINFRIRKKKKDQLKWNELVPLDDLNVYRNFLCLMHSMLLNLISIREWKLIESKKRLIVRRLVKRASRNE